MYKVAVICNDEIEAINLEILLSLYEKEHNVKFELIKYYSGEEYFKTKETESDLVFIEIAIPNLNGIEIAENLRKIRPEVPIVFFCDNAQFSLSCYEYGAIGYLLKPLKQQSVFSCLKRGIFILRRGMRRKVCIKGIQGAALVSIGDITYAESQGHHLYYHLHPKCEHRQKIIQVRGCLADAEELLQNFDFARCGVGYIVNLHHVLSIVNNAVYLPEVTLPISRAYKNEFSDTFIKYLTEREVKKL